MTTFQTLRRSFRLGASIVIGYVAGLLAIGCTPEPRSLPCSNDGQCQKANEQLRYCLAAHCVEYLGNSSCGEGNWCIDGACVIRCRSDRDCPARKVYHSGACGEI